MIFESFSMSVMWLSHWRCGAENVHFSFCWRPFVTLKYAKNAFAAGAPPRTPLGGAHDAPQDLLVGPPFSAPAAPPLSRLRR